MASNQDRELDEASEKLYAKGFNAGYQIEKDDSKLLSSLTKDNQTDDNVFMQGMVAGGKEYRREKFREELTKLEEKKKDRSKDKDRD